MSDLVADRDGVLRERHVGKTSVLYLNGEPLDLHLHHAQFNRFAELSEYGDVGGIAAVGDRDPAALHVILGRIKTTLQADAWLTDGVPPLGAFLKLKRKDGSLVDVNSSHMFTMELIKEGGNRYLLSLPRAGSAKAKA
ncbi:hypothetical protein QEH52_17495 [Coraliomargarita sp. SDUM461003]|uniref:Uncharacterized protein n=1 Tax=Thalassobacterium maritimum TaxID=3041265 RepID=A0ABU1AYT6_9BACT|nr:hypothetical protein [Coraliomargarita sp. SDUM461003]MDQ8209326.1 hypothetical protein [Coraliomargarita sp. SDUM461003]